MEDFAEVEYKLFPDLQGVDFASKGELLQTQLSHDLARSHLAEISPLELAHRIATRNWLTEYQPKSNAPNLEQVRGYLEAFHHLCEVEDWSSASELIFIRPNLANLQELHKQLGIWGYYREQIELYKPLLNKVNHSIDCICLQGLGKANRYLGNPEMAIVFHQKQLEIAQIMKDEYVIAQALGGLGRSCFYGGQYPKAINYHYQQLTIARKLENRKEEGRALRGLGYAYIYLEAHNKANKYFWEALELASKTGDLEMKLEAIRGLGDSCFFKGRYKESINSLQQFLEINKPIHNKSDQAIILNRLGSNYVMTGKYDHAIQYFEKALKITQEICFRVEEGRILNSLGIVYVYFLSNPQKGIEYFEKSLMIQIDTKNRVNESLVRSNIAYCYGYQNQYLSAIDQVNEALEIALRIQDKKTQAIALATLGSIYWHHRKYIQGLWKVIQSLFILPPWQGANSNLIFRKTIDLIKKVFFP